MPAAADIQTVVEGIANALEADATLVANTGGRIYHMSGQPSDPLPVLTFDVVSSDVTRYFNGNRQFDIDVEFNTWSARSGGTADAADSAGIDDRIYEVIDGLALTVPGLQRAMVLMTSRGVRILEEQAIRVVSRARVVMFAAG